MKTIHEPKSIKAALLGSILGLLCCFSSLGYATSMSDVPYDHDFLVKIYTGEFNRIGSKPEDKLSLFAVVQGFADAGCKCDVDTADLVNYSNYVNSAPEILPLVLFGALHPLYQQIRLKMRNVGCESNWGLTFSRNLGHYLQQLPTTQPPWK